MTNDELVSEIETQPSLMIAVATGSPCIPAVNDKYLERRGRIAEELQLRSLSDPNPHADLWVWYGHWSGGDMPNWQSRRVYIGSLYNPLIDQVRSRSASVQVFDEPTGWERVDRGVYEIRRKLEQLRRRSMLKVLAAVIDHRNF